VGRIWVRCARFADLPIPTVRRAISVNNGGDVEEFFSYYGYRNGRSDEDGAP